MSRIAHPSLPRNIVIANMAFHAANTISSQDGPRGEAGATGGPADPSTCPGLATQNFPNRKESAYFQTRPPWENQTVLVLLGASPCLTVITSFYEVQQPSSRPAYPHSK